ncbi:hypothetical protein ACH4E7_44620 [Kitasatospora sp. NPDC018058]|uniref:hypothetical protein n=1 Tax=Kitasatospora sp. NPDC018058 TaxID=3364025 RepID=UPI0037C16B08
MSDRSGRPARRPLAQPFSHRDAVVDQPLGERLLPVERSPFSGPADHVPAGHVPAGQASVARPAGAGRRPLGEGGLTYTGGTGLT